MIVEALFTVLTGLVEFILDLLPTTDAPEWMLLAPYFLNVAVGYGSGLGAWIPWSLVGQVFGAVLASVGIGFTIKVVRIIASFFTAGGGSAA